MAARLASRGRLHYAAPTVPRTLQADRFAPLSADVAGRWQVFPATQLEYFPGFLGIVVEEVRSDYARMRLPYRHVLDQPAGVLHGGAIASLIDTVVVPAIGSGYAELRRFVTVTMQVQYLAAIAGEDAVAEGWVEKRGRSLVFCRAEVWGSAGTLAATGTLVYKVSAIDRGERAPQET